MKNAVKRMRAAKNELAQFIQSDQFIGWVYSVDYETALVLANDALKEKAGGVPHNAFLTAASFDPDHLGDADSEELEVILLRVVGTASLPQDIDDIRTKIDHLMRKEEQTGEPEYDHLTQSQLQFGGLECQVLGTFYMRDGDLYLGSDIETFYSSSSLMAYRPKSSALRKIVNHLDPIRKAATEEAAADLGLDQPMDPIRIGSVRYTSTDRRHRSDPSDHVEVTIQPIDFLTRRTALFGMTRTGKSNAMKQIVSVVKRVSDESGLAIGQVIYDINGEYANANRADRGALSEVYPGNEVVRYRMMDTPGFEPLLNNFYVQAQEGHRIIRRVVQDNADAGQPDVRTFLGLSFDEPDPADRSLHTRWQVRIAAYQALLKRADFEAPSGLTVTFPFNQQGRQAVASVDPIGEENPAHGLTLDEAVRWFTAARQANQQSTLRSSSSGRPLFDEGVVSMLNMLTQQNNQGQYINGYKVLSSAQRYHDPRRTAQDVGEEIYQHLTDGRIVILDLSVGDPETRRDVSEQIARHIFTRSLRIFVKNERPPEIMIYTEESHNLIGPDAEPDETWPRIAKEGAKYHIGFVYATQEPTSMQRNILANTENWIVTHLNNEREVRRLAEFYDFADFARSLRHAQDVGFARVKTLSGPFVIPVQIDRFEPERERERALRVAAARKQEDDAGVSEEQSVAVEDQISDGTGGQSADGLADKRGSAPEVGKVDGSSAGSPLED